MTRALFRVVFSGPYVSVQDGGRRGYMRFGVPESGPMDRLALAAANTALGNPTGAAGIEVSLGGLVLECVEGRVGFAVAGGGFVVDLAGDRGRAWRVAQIEAGQRLTIRPGRWGAWTMLAFAGQLQSDTWLGSAATHALSGFGGGRLTAGQMLAVDHTRPADPRALPCPVIARPSGRVHVVMGPQDHFFDATGRQAFLNSIWRLSDAYDRMGMRLAGPQIMPAARLDMPSEGIARGAVQVSGEGTPTVLMADHQTTGGYPKLATVLDAELDAFAQIRPRDLLRFHAVTSGQAVVIARRRAGAVARYLDGLRRRAQV